MILFAPDGYDTSRPGMMGRQSAGAGFLRALVGGRRGEAVKAYGAGNDRSTFEAAVRAIDSEAATHWLTLDALETRFDGVCHRPDPVLEIDARLRLRAGPARYCLTGVTHTLSSTGAMDAITAMLTAPLTPWDALICTSSAAAEAVRRLQETAADYLRWKMGGGAIIGSPQTPIIPLGVHCADFEFPEAERQAARAEMDLAEGDVLALFVGRRSLAAKAHPQAMLQALQAAAERTGARVVLAECGRAFNQTIERVHNDAATHFAPNVRHITPGGDPAEVRKCWAAADLFVSLSDSVQETFGLTPLEAMAAGLPVVATDWNGYRETVRTGVDGFLIPTWAPEDGSGAQIAKAIETETVNYDRYLWATVSTTSVEVAPLVDALAALIASPQLRRQMGDAGRARARALFDWPHVFEAYRELWGELNARRLAVMDNPGELAWVESAPRSAPGRLDPSACSAITQRGRSRPRPTRLLL